MVLIVNINTYKNVYNIYDTKITKQKAKETKKMIIFLKNLYI